MYKAHTGHDGVMNLALLMKKLTTNYFSCNFSCNSFLTGRRPQYSCITYKVRAQSLPIPPDLTIL